MLHVLQNIKNAEKTKPELWYQHWQDVDFNTLKS